MRPLSAFQLAMLRSAADRPARVNGVGRAPEPALSTARSLERRGLVEVGTTDEREAGGRVYLVSLTALGRAECQRGS